MRKFTFSLLTSFFFSLCLFAQNSETGYAVYYADYLHGRQTALGEVYNMYELSCAHKTLPLGTLVRVTRLDNKKSVVVRVNDRGPYKPGRVVDLSKAAAEKVDLLLDGIAEVKVEVIGNGQTAPQNYQYTGVKGVPSEYNAPSQPANVQRDRPITVTATEMNPSLPDFYTSSTTMPSNLSAFLPNLKSSNQSPPQPTEQPAVYDAVPTAYEAFTADTDFTVKGGVVDLTQTRFYVQVGAYGNFDNAQRKYQMLKDKGITDIKLIEAQKADGSSVYRTWVGPYRTERTANQRKNMLVQEYKLRGIVLRED